MGFMLSTNLRTVIAELQLEREYLGQAIRSLEILASSGQRRKGRPRKVLAQPRGVDSPRPAPPVRKERRKTMAAG